MSIDEDTDETPLHKIPVPSSRENYKEKYYELIENVESNSVLFRETLDELEKAIEDLESYHGEIFGVTTNESRVRVFVYTDSGFELINQVTQSEFNELVSAVEDIESDLSSLQNDVSAVDDRVSELEAHGDEAHSTDELHSQFVQFPSYPDTDSVPDMPEGSIVYIEDEGGFYYEDGS